MENTNTVTITLTRDEASVLKNLLIQESSRIFNSRMGALVHYKFNDESQSRDYAKAEVQKGLDQLSRKISAQI